MLASKPTKTSEFLNLTLRELRDLTGVDIKNWSEWFNGKSTPNVDTLERVAVALNIPVVELFKLFLERRSCTMQSKEAKSA